VLLHIVSAARDTLPAFDLVGVSTVEGKHVVTRAVTDPKVYELDKLQ
jgi:hypothetical protein